MLPKSRRNTQGYQLVRGVDRAAGALTTQSAYGGKFRTCSFLPQQSQGSILRPPPALRTLTKIYVEVNRNVVHTSSHLLTPLNLPTHECFFAFRATQGCSQSEEKATTQRANG